MVGKTVKCSVGCGCARVPVLPLWLSSALSESVTPRSFLESPPFWSDGRVCKTCTLSVMRPNGSWRGSKQGPGIYQDPVLLSLGWSSANQEIFPLPFSLPPSPAPTLTRDAKPQPPAFVLSCFSPTLRDPMDYGLPGSSVHGILQARILEWVAMPSSRGSSDPGIEPASFTSPALAGRFFVTSATWEAPRSTLCYSNSISGCISKGNEIAISERHLHCHVCCSIFDNSQDMKQL